MNTYSPKAKEIERAWHEVDLKDKILGRASVEIAQMLMGKAKPYFVRHLDCGDFVVVTNAKFVKTTGKKADQKKYYSHSGYPHGFKAESFERMSIRKPEQIIYEAVKGMLPQNQLRADMLKRLYIYPEENHPYKEKFNIKEK